MKNINFFPLLVIILLFVFINEVKAEMDSYYLVLGERILSEGDEGADVAILQQKLKETGIYKGRVDGLYGSMTKNAVKKLQKNYGLDVDGIAGKKTLNILPKNNLVSRMDVSREEIMQLAYIIHGEARGENFHGKVAVGAVVLNRVRSNKFPNNIRKVILQKNQFSCMIDGQANYYPARSSIEAAKAALLGYDPSHGGLFFYNPEVATNLKWISRRPIIKRIGNHVFAR